MDVRMFGAVRALLAATFWFALLAFAQKSPAADDVVRIAVQPNDRCPALAAYSSPEGMTGFQRELLEAIARAERMRVEYISFAPEDSIRGAMSADQVDLIPLMVIDESTTAYFALSEPFVTTPIVAFGRWQVPSVKRAAQLNGARVVAVEGGVGAAVLNEAGVDYAPVQDVVTGLAAINEGTADYFVETELAGRYAMGQREPGSLFAGVRVIPLGTPDGAGLGIGFGVASSWGDPSRLVERINHGLKAVRGSGEYAAIYNKWLEGWLPLRLSQEDAKRLGKSGRRWPREVLRVGIDPTLMPPLLVGDSEANGYIAELVNEIGRTMKVQVDLRLLPAAQLRTELQSGAIDVIAGANYTDLNVLRMDFTRPFYATPGAILMREGVEPPVDPAQFGRLKAVVVRDTVGHAWARTSGFAAVTVVDDLDRAVENVIDGGADVLIESELAVRPYVVKGGGSERLRAYRIPGDGFIKLYGMAVRAGAKELLWDLEDSMIALDSSGARRELERKWLGTSTIREPFVSEISPLIAGAAIGSLIVVVAAVLWVLTLRRELSRRTARLRQEEARLKAITESVPAVVYGYLARPDGTRELRYSNRRLEEWGQAFRGLAGGGDPRSLLPAIHAQDRAEFERRMDESGGQIRRFQQEVRVHDDRGRDRWIQITLDPDPVTEGVLWHGIMQDTTELRLAAEALAQSERNFRQIFEATQDAILVFASGFGRILEVNSAGARLYGYTREQMLGMDATDLFDHPDEPAEQSESGGSVFRHRRRDGATIDVECSTTVVQYGGGPAMLSVNRDVTARTRFEEQRRQLDNQILQAQKMESLGLLAGGIAHDFNNLLVGIMGNASLARTQLDDLEGLGQTLDQIVLTTRRASDLTQQLLAYAGKARLSVQAVDLSAVAAEMVKLLGTRLSRGARMVFSFSPRSVVTMADPVQIRQIVMNLLTNASDALRDGIGVITIRTGVARFDRLYLSETFVPTDITEGEYAFLEIADDGCGMDQADMQRIFDPFFTTKFVGRGLGLSVALSIVQRHRGAIKVFSERDRGTVFRLLLPLAPVPQAVIREPKPVAADRAMRVLLVGGGASARERFALSLRAAGASVVSAGGVDEALERVSDAGEIGVVCVMDPGGGEAARLRERIPGAALVCCGRTPAQERASFDHVLEADGGGADFVLQLIAAVGERGGAAGRPL